MKKTLLFLIAMMAMVVLPSFAQEVNMSRYITLTVKSGEDIKLNFKATQANTPVRIVSGGNTKNIIVNNTWYTDNNPDFTVTADGTTMTIYGELDGINCSYNLENLTSLDVSKNPQLTTLGCYDNQLTSLDVSKNTNLEMLACYDNPFSTNAVNMIYCSLPDRTDKYSHGECYIIKDTIDPSLNSAQSATSDIAKKKNWQVKYFDGTKVPSKGNYKCK